MDKYLLVVHQKSNISARRFSGSSFRLRLTMRRREMMAIGTLNAIQIPDTRRACFQPWFTIMRTKRPIEISHNLTVAALLMIPGSDEQASERCSQCRSADRNR